MRFLFCYDVEDDKVRTRLVKVLEEFGERIQYSVFEFKLTEAAYIKFKNRLKMSGVLKNKNISVSLYPLCEGCYKKIERYGVNRLLDEDSIVF